MKALLTGWFSFEDMGATAGDLMALDVARGWLERAGCPYDVALAPPFSGGVDWRTVEPSGYSDLVFVCGPIGNGPPVTELLERFRGCRATGLDLSMLQPLEDWNPFDRLWERDSSRTARPDVSFLGTRPPVPVIGLVLIDTQPEYRGLDFHQAANEALRKLAASREAAIVNIDTRLDANATGLRTPAEVESLIARVDVVLTTRLHGTVLALKNGVPVLVVDSVAGGHKVRRQAQTLGWPAVFTAEALHQDQLQRTLDWCLSQDARACARACRDRARRMLAEVRDGFVAAFRACRKSPTPIAETAVKLDRPEAYPTRSEWDRPPACRSQIPTEPRP